MLCPIQTRRRRICLFPTLYVARYCGCSAQLTYANQPFPLDYHQTLLSLLDVLSELYNKISKILGPSPFSNSGNSMMGPLGLLSPHPGVSYLFNGAETASANDSDSSLWGIAHASAGSVYNGGPGSPPPNWTSTLGDTVRQIDNKLKVRTGPSDSFLRIHLICHDGIPL